MNITDVRVDCVEDTTQPLRGYATIVLDESFVIYDFKIVQGSERLYVDMPKRELGDKCHKCRAKNTYRSNYCCMCGAERRPNRAPRKPNGKRDLYKDVLHPVNVKMRTLLEHAIITEYERLVSETRASDSA